MQNLKILNYQGNKASLMPFIKTVLSEYANPGDVVFDIFSGSGSVSVGLNSEYSIIANDAELYASIIADASLNVPNEQSVFDIVKRADEWYQDIKAISNGMLLRQEQYFLKLSDTDNLNLLYDKLPTVWNNQLTVKVLRDKAEYNLFQSYYAGTYFGIKQAFEIDQIIKRIQKESKFTNIYFASLFYAMKEAVFSKDGHMAQPLNREKYPQRLLKMRNVSILDKFMDKLKNYQEYSENYHVGNSTILNMDFKKSLDNLEVINKAKVVYADPPYTDMQYSRYYHLLNVAAQYNYPDLTIIGGKYTKGLYTEGRNQSILSQKGKAKSGLQYMIEKTKIMNKTLMISYAYPENKLTQKIDRYTISIEELIDLVQSSYGSDKTHVYKKQYTHANNRNSIRKKVYEYLIVGGDRVNEK